MVQQDRSEQEKAEGSRESLNVPAAADMESGAGQLSEPEKPAVPGSENPRSDKGGSAQPGAGITNRPMQEERENQDAVPERGRTKGEEESEGEKEGRR